MRLKKEFVEKISKRIIESLIIKDLIIWEGDHNRLESIISDIIIEDLMVEDRLNEEVKQLLGEHVFATSIPKDVALTEAPSHGKAVFSYDIRSRAAKAYIDLAKEVLNRGG